MCDGSYKNGVGSFVWGLPDKKNPSASLLRLLAPLHGDYDQSSPLRAELYALLGALKLTRAVVRAIPNTPKASIKIYSDCQNAINPTIKPYQIAAKSKFANDSDVKAELRTTYKQISKYSSVQDVKSHQRGKYKFVNLSLAAKLNTYMHGHATSYHNRTSTWRVHDIPGFLKVMSSTPDTDPLPKSTPIPHSRMIPHLPKSMDYYPPYL